MSNKVQIVKQPLYGSVYWNGVKFIYTPKPGFVGKDTYIYTMSNGLTSQTLTNYVNTVNQAPSAENIVLPNVDINQITLIDISNYVVDYDNLVNPVSLKSITQPSQGKAYITDSRTISYQSNGYNAIDNFTYTITDGQFEKTASISLTSINGSTFSNTVNQDSVDAVNNTLTEINLVLSNTGNWNDAYNVISSSSGRWNSNDPTQFLEVFSTVSSNSAKWESSFFHKNLYDASYSIITANSANWNSIEAGLISLSTVIFANSANWDSTYTTVSTHSADWEAASSAITALQLDYTLSSVSWTDAMNLVQNESANWGAKGTSTVLQFNSANWNTALSIVTSTSALWEVGANNASSFMTTYSAQSALWELSFNIVQTTSASWGATTSVELTILTAYSGLWNDAYNIVTTNSAAWSELSSKYIKYDQAYSALTGTSGNWEAAYAGLSVLSAQYLSIINLVSTNSAAWLTGGPTIDLEVHDLKVNNNLIIYGNLTAQGTGNVITTQVVDTSAFHIVNTGLTDALKVTKTQSQGALGIFERATSSTVPFNNNGVTSTEDNTQATLSCLDYLNTQYTILSSISGILKQMLSVGNQMANDLPNKDSYYPSYRTLVNNLTSVVSNSNNKGTINYPALPNGVGKYYVLNTTLSVTPFDFLINTGWATLFDNILTDASMILDTNIWGIDSFELMNDDEIPRLVLQHNTQYNAILNYYSNTSDTVMSINTNNRVGINTRVPNEALTVVGNISASGFLYGQTPSLYTNFQNNSANYDATSTYVVNNSAAIAGMILSASNYSAILTYLTGASANINSLIARKPVYDTYYNNLIAQYPLNAASYSFISANSATMGGVVDSLFRTRYADYEDAYTYYTTATGNTIAQINFIFDGSGDIVPIDAYGVVQIPCNIRILEWAIYANVPSTTQVEVAASNYANYPTFTVISEDDILATDCPQISSVIKNKSSNLPGWTTQLNAGDLLKFKVLQNSNASFFTVALKCQKI